MFQSSIYEMTKKKILLWKFFGAKHGIPGTAGKFLWLLLRGQLLCSGIFLVNLYILIGRDRA